VYRELLAHVTNIPLVQLLIPESAENINPSSDLSSYIQEHLEFGVVVAFSHSPAWR
jgi:hypothetical protein